MIKIDIYILRMCELLYNAIFFPETLICIEYENRFFYLNILIMKVLLYFLTISCYQMNSVSVN